MKDCHLPTAVRFRNRDQLVPLTDRRLGSLLQECREWSFCMETYRSALTTAAARTEWHVHTARDRAEVADAVARLKNEIQNRIDVPMDALAIA